MIIVNRLRNYKYKQPLVPPAVTRWKSKQPAGAASCNLVEKASTCPCRRSLLGDPELHLPRTEDWRSECVLSYLINACLPSLIIFWSLPLLPLLISTFCILNQVTLK